MEFKYTATVSVDEETLQCMCDMVKDKSTTIRGAISWLTSSFDEYSYYEIDNIADQLAAEIERRVKEGER